MSYYKPLISVIIPTYNRGFILEETINSVLNQTYQFYELIIVDDASTDNTENIVKEIKDNRIKYIKLDVNSKGTKPRNIGINLSKGKYIAFLDSDDKWLPEKLEKQLNFIESSKGKNVDVICFTGLIIKDQFKEIYQNNRHYNNENIMEYILVGRNEVQTSTYMVSSSIAKNILFDETLKKHQDWDFFLRLNKNNTTVLCLTECLTVWNVNDNNNRITNSYKNEDFSLNWFKSNKDEFNIKSQWAFKVIILIDNLIERKEILKATKIAFTAFIYRSINLTILMKTIMKIFIPKKLHNHIKYFFNLSQHKLGIVKKI